MAESENDDLADALSRMAGDDTGPSESEAPAPIDLPKPAVRPVAIKPVAARPTAPMPKPPIPIPPSPPASPRTARPVAPTLGTAPAAASPPTREARPSAPTLTSPAAARKDRPSAPTIRQVTIAPTDAETDGGQSTGLTAEAGESQIIDDDDSVIVPAPEASVFVSKPKTNAEVREKIARKKNLEFRRTLIPILLTSGVLMLAFGLLRFAAGADSTLSNLPIWISIVLWFAAAILLSLAVVNMLSVKAQLAADRKPAA
jgi:hypothetical protein